MNFNFHISRYAFLLIVVAAFFVLLVIKAFTYLPEDQGDTLFLQNAKNKTISQASNDEDVVEVKQAEINEAEQDKYDSDDTTDKLFEVAEQYLKNGNYDSALSVYLKIVSIVDEPKKYAECYDGLAKIYSAQGKYIKALEKAKLANQYETNDKRKLALAKLYHKIGDTVNEQNMMNEILEGADY